MDGLALLTEVMAQHPSMVRIVLSGHASEESTIESVGMAHQFLAKPCDAEILKQTVNHAFALRDLLSDGKLKESLSQMKSVPSMPNLYQELLEELQHPDSSTKRVGEIISQDPGMTTKILQMVNSAFFGLPRQVSTTGQAAALLGVDTIKALVLSLDVFSQFEGTAVHGLTPESVQKHSAETAAAAKRIATAESTKREVADASLMAGFLHDVGKLILAQDLPDQYREVMTAARAEGRALCEAEREVLGATHAEVGAYLLGLWGLPEPMVEATAFHHSPGRSFARSFAPLTAVHAANVLVHESGGESNGKGHAQLDIDYSTQLELADRFPAWRSAGSESTSAIHNAPITATPSGRSTSAPAPRP